MLVGQSQIRRIRQLVEHHPIDPLALAVEDLAGAWIDPYTKHLVVSQDGADLDLVATEVFQFASNHRVVRRSGGWA